MPTQPIAPYIPHLDREEPEFRQEDDIPSDDGETATTRERHGGANGKGDERPHRKVERE